MRAPLGIALLALGALLVLSAGPPLAFDLFRDSYLDTILDHPREAGFVLLGLGLSAAGVVLTRRDPGMAGARPAVHPARVLGGAALVLVAGVLAYLFTALCGFGCSLSEYWTGITLFALAAAGGLVLIARSVHPRQT